MAKCQYGILYAFTGDSIAAFKIVNSTTWIEEYEDWESGNTYGGYEKVLQKTFHLQSYLDNIDLVHDMSPQHINAWKHLPARYMYLLNYADSQRLRKSTGEILKEPQRTARPYTPEPKFNIDNL